MRRVVVFGGLNTEEDSEVRGACQLATSAGSRATLRIGAQQSLRENLDSLRHDGGAQSTRASKWCERRA